MAWIDGKLCELTETGYRQVRPLVRTVKDGSVMVFVPGGEFEMGDGQQGNCPKHTVRLDAYYIGVYSVTNRQYAQFVGETGHRPPDNSIWRETSKQDHPVVEVSWDDAQSYAVWSGCCLPTEAQWEKAARGPGGLLYPWGDDWDESKCRNDRTKGSEQTSAVWDYPEGISGYGTYQQSGNVWEWCGDWYDESYYQTAEAKTNPTGPTRGSLRVCRGGGWRYGDASLFRGAHRAGCDPGYRIGDMGFRLVRAACGS